MDHDRVLPQDNEGEAGAGGLLEEASAYARAVLESVQAAAGTTYCKGVQINGAEKVFLSKYGESMRKLLYLCTTNSGRGRLTLKIKQSGLWQ